jgi:hypothetical protein
MIAWFEPEAVMDSLLELWNWLASLDAQFAFLVALPFAVGALGVLAVLLEQRRRAAAPSSPSRAQRRGRAAHVQ